jgi:serine/threonine-protein kinase
MQNSPARSGIDVGSVIAETYTIEALIGRGGMGAVFLASHKRLPGKKVAIKLLHAELSGDEVLARFKREAEIASRLAHPNIVGVHDYNVTPDGTPYVVLDYLEGASLSAHLKDGPLPLDRVFSIVRQVASALAAAHREGIVHRDLKPQNIFLVPSESEGRAVDVAKVLDFGISKIRGSDTVKTQDSTLLGTPQYMAPEQATGQHDKVDERTDLFALGAIVHEMVSGQPAFSGANIPEVVFKVVYEQPAALPDGTPPHVVAAVARAMAKKQDERFPDVGAFVEALTGSPLPVTRNPSIPPTGGATPRSRSTAKEAFDQTVGSGDHGPTALPAPVTGANRSSEGTAPTIASHRDTPVPAEVAPRSRGPRIALVAGVLAIAAGVAIVFVGRSGSHEAAQDTPRVAARGDDTPGEVESPSKVKPASASERGSKVKTTAPANTASPSTTTTTAQATTTPSNADASANSAVPATTAPPNTGAAKNASAPTAPEPPTHGAEPPKPPATPTHGAEPPKPPATHPTAEATAEPPDATTGDDAPASADDETITRLAGAETALTSRDFARAEQLANAVITGDHSKPAQLARAHVVHGIVECAAHNDRGLALADLRAITAKPLRKKLVEGCAAVGMQLDAQ